MCPSPRPGCTGFLQHHQPGHRAQVQAPLTLRLSCNLDQETLSLFTSEKVTQRGRMELPHRLPSAWGLEIITLHT